MHHQSIGRLGEGLTLVGRAPDGMPEAMEVDAARWAVCVQWHPEDTAATDPQQQGIFDELVRQGVALVSPPTDQAFGHRTLFFRDPDGNLLEVYAEI